MLRTDQRRRGWAVGLSLGFHVALLAGLLLQPWRLEAPPPEVAGPPQPIIPVLLLPHAPIGARNGTQRTGELKLHRRDLSHGPPLPAAARPLLVAPEAHTPATPQSAAVAAPAPGASGPPSGQTGTGAAAAAAADLSAALRHGVLGCANPASLSRAEREACEVKLGAGAKHEPVLAEGRDPRIQAYYDAVAKAKAPDKPWTPTRAIGAMGPFDDVPRGSNDRLPFVGCRVAWGAGEKKPLPSHWLKLGPCFIAPPKGPLTPEVDVTPPDQDLSRPPPRSGPQPPPGVRREAAAGPGAAGTAAAKDAAKTGDVAGSPR